MLRLTGFNEAGRFELIFRWKKDQKVCMFLYVIRNFLD